MSGPIAAPYYSINSSDLIRLQEDEFSVKVVVSLQVILMSIIISFTISTIVGAIYVAVLSIIGIIGLIIWCIKHWPNHQITPVHDIV